MSTINVNATPANEEAVDDSHKEAPSTTVEVEDPDKGEEKLFGEKAILYRFDKAGNEWKERGVGIIKILKNTEAGICRILMRRDQTYRICANHYILPDLELKAQTGSDKAFKWIAEDYADNVKSHDILSVKFKSAEIASNFKKNFEEAQKANKAIIESGAVKKEEEKEAPKEEKKE